MLALVFGIFARCLQIACPIAQTNAVRTALSGEPPCSRKDWNCGNTRCMLTVVGESRTRPRHLQLVARPCPRGRGPCRSSGTLSTGFGQVVAADHLGGYSRRCRSRSKNSSEVKAAVRSCPVMQDECQPLVDDRLPLAEMSSNVVARDGDVGEHVQVGLPASMTVPRLFAPVFQRFASPASLTGSPLAKVYGVHLCRRSYASRPP